MDLYHTSRPQLVCLKWGWRFPIKQYVPYFVIIDPIRLTMTYIVPTRVGFYKSLKVPSVLTKQCGEVPGMVDRWHHLVLLSLEIFSNWILYSPGEISVNLIDHYAGNLDYVVPAYRKKHDRICKWQPKNLGYVPTNRLLIKMQRCTHRSIVLNEY